MWKNEVTIAFYSFLPRRTPYEVTITGTKVTRKNRVGVTVTDPPKKICKHNVQYKYPHKKD